MSTSEPKIIIMVPSNSWLRTVHALNVFNILTGIYIETMVNFIASYPRGDYS